MPFLMGGSVDSVIDCGIARVALLAVLANGSTQPAIPASAASPRRAAPDRRRTLAIALMSLAFVACGPNGDAESPPVVPTVGTPSGAPAAGAPSADTPSEIADSSAPSADLSLGDTLAAESDDGTEGPAPAAGDAYYVYVSNEYDASITVIDSGLGSVIDTITISGRPGEVRPRGMAVSPDGQLIYVSVSDFFPLLETPEDKIVVLDVLTNEVAVEIAAGGNPERVAISPDGTQAWAALEAIARGGGFDTRTGEALGTFQTGVEPEGVAVSPDGRWVYVTAETTHSVSVIDRPGLQAAGHFVVGNRPRDVLFSNDGTRAFVSAEIGGAVSVVDVSEHEVIEVISLGLDARPVEMALSPDGGRLYVAGGGTSAVYVIDTATYEIIATIRQRMGRRPWGIAITPDGRRVYTANGLSDSVSVIDTECLCVIDNITVGRGPHSVEVGVRPR